MKNRKNKKRLLFWAIKLKLNLKKNIIRKKLENQIQLMVCQMFVKNDWKSKIKFQKIKINYAIGSILIDLFCRKKNLILYFLKIQTLLKMILAKIQIFSKIKKNVK